MITILFFVNLCLTVCLGMSLAACIAFDRQKFNALVDALDHKNDMTTINLRNLHDTTHDFSNRIVSLETKVHGLITVINDHQANINSLKTKD